MDAIKGLARRATQAIREKVTQTDASENGVVVEESKKLRQYQKASEKISMKLIRAAELLEELGVVLKEVGEEYENVPDLLPEAAQLSVDVVDVGNKLISSAQEHQKGIKEKGFDLLRGFVKNMPKLKDAEEARRKCQLEHEFFRKKVLDLRRSPPKDHSRIPRNEQILESWRVELWRATENYKTVCSQLYDEGKRSIDQSVLTLVQVYSNFLSIAANGFKQQFVNARLPVYATAPLLPPAPLPPNPMPPYQQPPPPPAVPLGYAHGPYGQQPQAWQQAPQPPPQREQWDQQAAQQQQYWTPQQPQQPHWGQPPEASSWYSNTAQHRNATEQPLPQKSAGTGTSTSVSQIEPISSYPTQYANPDVPNYAHNNGNGSTAQSSERGASA